MVIIPPNRFNWGSSDTLANTIRRHVEDVYTKNGYPLPTYGKLKEVPEFGAVVDAIYLRFKASDTLKSLSEDEAKSTIRRKYQEYVYLCALHNLNWHFIRTSPTVVA